MVFFVLIFLLGFFAVVHNVLKDGLTMWAPEFLKDRYGISDSISILLTIALPILGVFGAVISIKLNKFIKNFIVLITIFFFIGSIAMAAMLLIPNLFIIFAVSCLGIVVCMMHGINNIANSLAPLKMRDKVDSGRLAGILNGCCYAGSAISSYGIGKIADIGGWQMVLSVLLFIGIFAMIIGMFGSKYCE